MNIDILCSDPRHPVNEYLTRWIATQASRYKISLKRKGSELTGGDILFLVSCSEIIPSAVRNKYGHAMVLHASDLPNGRGWSPHVWAILDGRTELILSLLVAEDSVDSGAIWAKTPFSVPRDALFDDINAALFEAEIELMRQGIAAVEAGQTPNPQVAGEPSYYPKRQPQDSKLDPTLSIESQFDKIRVADPLRYPAYFDLHGTTYILTLRKAENETEH